MFSSTQQIFLIIHNHSKYFFLSMRINLIKFLTHSFIPNKNFTWVVSTVKSVMINGMKDYLRLVNIIFLEIHYRFLRPGSIIKNFNRSLSKANSSLIYQVVKAGWGLVFEVNIKITTMMIYVVNFQWIFLRYGHYFVFVDVYNVCYCGLVKGGFFD